MKIILIRHGETHANKNPAKPSTLTTKGKNQVDALARRLKNCGIDAIWSSTLERALVTAKELHKFNKKAKFFETDELHEIYGFIIGGPEKDNTRPNRYDEDLKRAESFWKKMIKWKYNKVAVVCHGYIIRFFIAKVLEMPIKNAYRIKTHNASVSIIEIRGNEKKLLRVNDVEHITKKLISSESGRI